MTDQHDAVLTALPEAEARDLLRRAAGARGLQWPDEPGAVRDLGGFTANITHQPGPEQVVWATLPGQEGLLALFREGRLLATADRRLARITGVQPVSLPGLDALALMVDDRYEEMVGAFMRAERRRIYVWDGRRLKEVFQGTLLDEQVSHPQWDNPRGKRAWQLRRKEGEVTLGDGLLTYKLRTAALEAPGGPQEQVPPRPSFRLVSVEDAVERYCWNPRLRRFERIEGECGPVNG